jgi:PAS domain S-box-containing protein
MHKLLKRQLRKLADGQDIPQKFIDAIDSAYHEFDDDLMRSERILDQSMKELFSVNEELKEFANKKEQEALSLSTRLTEIIETVSEVIFQVSIDGKWVFLNPAFTDITGFQIENAIGKTVAEFIHQEDTSIFETNCGQLNSGEKTKCQSVVRFKTKEGTYKWVEVRSQVKTDSSHVQHITGTITDVNDAYRMQIESKKLALVAEKTQNLIVITNPKAEITYVNDAFVRLTGYSVEEVIGNVPGSFLQGEETNKATRTEIREHLDNLESYTGEILNYSKDKRPYWLKLAIDPIFSDDGRHLGFIAVETEITKEKERQHELSKINARLNSLLENLNSAVLVEDENRRIVLTNELFLDYFKIPAQPSDLLGIDCSSSAEQSMHLMKNPDLFVSRINEIVEKRVPVLEERIEFADGSIMERDYIPIIIDAMYFGHLWQYRDITDRVNHQVQIEQSEAKYRTLLENLNLGLLEVDIEGKILKAFPGFCELTGYSEKEIQGEIANELLLDEKGRELSKAQLERRKTGETAVYEQRLKKKDGSLVWALISATPVYDNKRKVTGAIGVHMDLSKQKESEVQLKQYASELETINTELDQFAYIVSHDLKAPLRAINNLASWLEEDLEGVLSDDLRENFDLMKGRVARMENLINGILDYSRAGRMSHQQETVDVSELLDEIIDGIASDERITVKKETNMPTIRTERIPLQQIFMNLISNGIKYNDKENPIITINCDEKQDYFVFSVSDNGHGIDERYFEKVFQIFQTLQARDQVESTGVGLAIVKKMLDEKDCSIWIDSELNKGTTFTFEWPK